MYDIARSLPRMGELNAIQLANNRLRQETRLTKQSADYFDETGLSEAEQRTRALDIQAEGNEIAAGNMQARFGELSLNMSKEHRDQFNNLIENSALVQQYIDLNPEDEKGAQELWQVVLDDNEIPDDTPMREYDPKKIKAIATMSQVTDPEAPRAYINHETFEVRNIDIRDRKQVQEVLGSGWSPYQVSTQSSEFPTKTEWAGVRGLQANTQNFLKSGLPYLELMRDSPNINTLVGKLANIGIQVEQNVEALFQELTPMNDKNDPVQAPQVYMNRLQQLGVDNTRLQAMMVSLAYQAAKTIAEAAGRDVSNQDVTNFMKQIGNSQNPQAMAATFMDTARQVDRAFRDNYRIRAANVPGMPKEFEGDLGLSALEEVYKAIAAPRREAGDRAPQTNRSTRTIQTPDGPQEVEVVFD